MIPRIKSEGMLFGKPVPTPGSSPKVFFGACFSGSCSRSFSTGWRRSCRPTMQNQQRLMDMPEQDKKVAVIGLGSMGYGMAVSLRRKGLAVSGFDVRPEVAERLARDYGGHA